MFVLLPYQLVGIAQILTLDEDVSDANFTSAKQMSRLTKGNKVVF